MRAHKRRSYRTPSWTAIGHRHGMSNREVPEIAWDLGDAMTSGRALPEVVSLKRGYHPPLGLFGAGPPCSISSPYASRRIQNRRPADARFTLATLP